MVVTQDERGENWENDLGKKDDVVVEVVRKTTRSGRWVQQAPSTDQDARPTDSRSDSGVNTSAEPPYSRAHAALHPPRGGTANCRRRAAIVFFSSRKQPCELLRIVLKTRAPANVLKLILRAIKRKKKKKPPGPGRRDEARSSAVAAAESESFNKIYYIYKHPPTYIFRIPGGGSDSRGRRTAHRTGRVQRSTWTCVRIHNFSPPFRLWPWWYTLSIAHKLIFRGRTNCTEFPCAHFTTYN